MKKIGARSLNWVIRSFLDWFSIYLVPVVIASVTVITIFLSPTNSVNKSGSSLGIHVIKDDSASLTVDRAIVGLIDTPKIEFLESDLSQSPFWLLFDVPSSTETVLEFPVPHSMELTCWDSKTFELLGLATRNSTKGMIALARGGFSLDSRKLGGRSVVCRIVSSGPSRMSVRSWNSHDFTSAVNTFQRNSGLLDGGLVVLALFVFLTAIINRQTTYVIYAAWLFGNLRLAGLASGADTLWLGYSIPMEWLNWMHALTMSIYYVLTVALFSRVFSADMKRIGFFALQRWNLWTCPIVLIMVLLPYRLYLPMLWIFAGIVCVNIVVLLSRLIFVTRSRVAIWFGLAFTVVLFSTLNEVIAVAFGQTALIDAANFVTSSLVSSLMAAMAIAQEMRDEHQERLRVESALQITYNKIPIGLMTLNNQGLILRSNPTLNLMLGHEVISTEHRLVDYFGHESWESLLNALKAGNAVEMELYSATRDKWFLVRAQSNADRIEGSIQDISERVRATERLLFLADHDTLTGVLNRRGIEKVLDRVVISLSSGEVFSLAYIDLDRFKLINDLYGHAAGDEVLRQICQRVQPYLGQEDQFGRVGGDEFVIVFGQATLAEAAKQCKKIIDSIENSAFLIEDKAFRVGGCIGLIEVRDGINVEDAIAGADRACRDAKKSSGNRLVLYERDSAAFNERDHELQILKQFGVDTPPQGLFLVMQPIMSLRRPYDSMNFEVLLRMHRPDNSVESAGRIITTAEKNGRIAVIDRWVLVHAMEWVEANFEKLEKTRFVNVNLSGGSLNDERFLEDAFAIIAAHPKAASLMCFEITESVAVSDINNTLRFVNKVRDFGAKLALDDFGVGYTSLSYLNSLSADVLKIDGSLISSALSHPANMSIIEAIANLTSNLGMTSIAEWPNDLDTIQALVDIGIDYVQSFAIGRPQMPDSILSANSAADFIENKAIADYVKNVLSGNVSEEFWMQTSAVNIKDMH